MSGFETAITLFENVFFKSSFNGTFLLMQLAIIIFTLAMLTRKVSDWKTLAYPVCIGWIQFGMPINVVVLYITGIIFVFDNLSVKMVENIWGSIRSGVKRIDVKKEMSKIRENTRISDAKKWKKSKGTSGMIAEYEREALGRANPLRVLGMSSRNDATTMRNLSNLGVGRNKKLAEEQKLEQASLRKIGITGMSNSGGRTTMKFNTGDILGKEQSRLKKINKIIEKEGRERNKKKKRQHPFKEWREDYAKKRFSSYDE